MQHAPRNRRKQRISKPVCLLSPTVKLNQSNEPTEDFCGFVKHQDDVALIYGQNTLNFQDIADDLYKLYINNKVTVTPPRK